MQLADIKEALGEAELAIADQLDRLVLSLHRPLYPPDEISRAVAAGDVDIDDMLVCTNHWGRKPTWPCGDYVSAAERISHRAQPSR